MPRPVRFCIEHLEEDDRESKNLPAWVCLEYRHMLQLAPESSTVHFTSLSQTSASQLSDSLRRTPTDSKPVASSSNPLANPSPHTAPILALLEELSIPPSRVCLLDPKAEKELSPEDFNEDDAGAVGFDMFLFGGILGDDPPLDRTKVLRQMGFEGRRLGPVQMTTDTALGVVKLVVVDKISLEKIEYCEYPTISFSAQESVEMPFRYIKGPDGLPLMPQGMREHLKKDLDQSFEF